MYKYTFQSLFVHPHPFFFYTFRHKSIHNYNCLSYLMSNTVFIYPTIVLILFL